MTIDSGVARKPTSSSLRKMTFARLAASSLVALVLACGSCGGGGGGGGTAAPARGPGDTPEAKRFDSLSVRFLRSTDDGRATEVGRLERPIAEFRDKAVSLLIRRAEVGEADRSKGPARFEQRFEVGAEKVALPAIVVDCATPATCTTREWLELELRGPQGLSRKVERLLYAKESGGAAMPGYRRYTVVAVPDAVSRDEIARRVETSKGELRLDERRSAARKLAAEAEKAPPDQATAFLARLDELDAGGPMGHLLALGFAAESDWHTERLAQLSAVTLTRQVPRILITTSESRGNDGRSQLSLDLRLDEVGGASANGPAATRLFQIARGMQESMLEGAYLKPIAGEAGTVNTARLMNEARKKGIQTVLLGARNRAEVSALRLPVGFAALVNSTLDRGHEVVLPRSAVSFAGRSRWGFWDIEPSTGVTIGVMEGGQHQVMVEIPTMNKEVPLNPKMGFFVGLSAGMIQSEFAYAALMLKYGEVNEQLIAELKAMLANSACSACPELNLNAEATIKLGEDCYKMEIGKVDVVKFDFCEKYGEGFKCAVGMLIASLTGGNQLPVTGEGEIKLKIGCTEVKASTGDD